jgi:hypothetical protein
MDSRLPWELKKTLTLGRLQHVSGKDLKPKKPALTVRQ